MKAVVALAVSASKAGKDFLAQDLALLACEGIDTNGYDRLTFCYFAEAGYRGCIDNGPQGELNLVALNLLSFNIHLQE